MMAHGQEDTTEIIGTQGKPAINAIPQASFDNTYTSTGINRGVYRTTIDSLKIHLLKKLMNGRLLA